MKTKHSNNTAALMRRAWIERQLRADGTFNLDTGVEVLGVNRAQVSAEMRALQEANPTGVTYDQRRKCYVWKGGAIATKLPAFIASVIVTDAKGTRKKTA